MIPERAGVSLIATPAKLMMKKRRELSDVMGIGMCLTKIEPKKTQIQYLDTWNIKIASIDPRTCRRIGCLRSRETVFEKMDSIDVVIVMSLTEWNQKKQLRYAPTETKEDEGGT
jgi:hypothetical protein